MENTRKSRDPLYITIIVLLLGGMGFFIWSWMDVNKTLKTCQQEMGVCKADNDTMKAMLEKNGMVDFVSEDLKSNLQMLLDQYSDMKTNNAELNAKVARDEARVQELMAQLEEAEKDKKGNFYTILALRRETETLRKIMKSYVHTIDSLNTLNQGLHATIKDKDNTITEVTTQRDEIAKKNENLEQKVAQGSRLKATPVSATAIRLRSGGKQMETTRAGRADMIKACMTIVENRIAKPGAKEIYMVVITPGGSILTDNTAVTVATEEGNTAYSLKREIDYQNANMDLCMYAEIKEGTEMKAGTYIVKIYAEKALIGNTTFTLK